MTNGVFKERLLLETGGNRTARTALQLIVAVAAGDARIVGIVPFQKPVFDGDVLVDIFHVTIEGHVNGVFALLRLRHEGKRIRHSRRDRAEGPARRLHAIHRHGHVPPFTHAPLCLGEASQRVVGEHPVTVLARLRHREVGLQRNVLRSGGNLAARPDEPRRAVFDLQRMRGPHRFTLGSRDFNRHRRRRGGKRGQNRPRAADSRLHLKDLT